MILDQILKNYEQQKKIIDTDNDKLKKKMKALAEPLTKEILSGLNNNVALLHKNQQTIELEIKNIKASLSKFYKETANWLQLYNSLNESLKSMGDVVNWSKIIEEDLKELVNKKEK